MPKVLLTCRQMSARINAQHPKLGATRFTVWNAATRLLGLTPAHQAEPTEGQKKRGGAIMFFTEAQERKVTARLLADYRPGEGEWKKLPRKRRSTATPTNAA